ncbi:carbonic anhydrase [Actinotalea ferrariae CF5-4]|uniref:carbonic anhydrase n=1 Tax=Actinotalea ferrariae CF5-4 TaxID=948458 RepID=A0A021VUE6_9CELL|nr:carbonic anhydrase [Actinotalea ferrariae]EYR63670.1 carbonic anhydrase [Actinotalea ferrariae CF5-4]
MSSILTPAQAWRALQDGNDRFVRGAMKHPSQGIDHRSAVSSLQEPFAVVFGCSDSRVAAELVFDRGLGDLFVVRTAGHVVDTTVLGSIEYGVQVLGAPLVVVLGHDSCGAVGAAVEALRTGVMPTGFVRAVVDRVIPSVVSLTRPADATEGAGRGSLAPSAAELGQEHVGVTVRMLQSYSAYLREGVEAGTVAVVGAEYALAEGRVRVVEVAGAVEG